MEFCSWGKKQSSPLPLIFQKFKRNAIFEVFIYWYHTIEPTGRSVETLLEQYLLEHLQNFIRTLILSLLTWAIIALRQETEKEVPKAEWRGRKSSAEKS